LARAKARFIDAYIVAGTILGACRLVRVDRQTYYNWRKRDSAFAAAVDAAESLVDETIETELIRRGLDKSDAILIFLAKRRMPQKYGDKAGLTLCTK
jgi:hypothetical protein